MITRTLMSYKQSRHRISGDGGHMDLTNIEIELMNVNDYDMGKIEEFLMSMGWLKK